MSDVQAKVRRQAVQAVADAAKDKKLSISADGVAMASQPELMVLNVPAAEIEGTDFKDIFSGQLVLDKTPVMYWYLAGPLLGEKGFPFGEGLYTVVADQKKGTASLRNAKGDAVAGGNLELNLEPHKPTPEVKLKLSASGSITKLDIDIKKKHVEVCGNASVEVGSASVKVEGCISVNW